MDLQACAENQSQIGDPHSLDGMLSFLYIAYLGFKAAHMKLLQQSPDEHKATNPPSPAPTQRLKLVGAGEIRP